MTIRPVHRLFRHAILGGGTLTSLLLGWTGTSPLYAQPATPRSPAPPVAAQQPIPVQRNYLNKHVIRLPIEMEQNVRQAVQEIHLYVKDQPGAAWKLTDKVGAAQESFTFQAPRDGEYWFTMVTLDKQGRSHPADVRNEPPGLAVIIDTQPPAIELTNLGSVADLQMIQIEITDPHLDIGKTRMLFQGGDKVFRDMLAVPGRANVYCIPAEAVRTGLIRASTEDLANNQGFVEMHLSTMKTAAAPSVAGTAAGQPERKTPGDAAPLQLPMNLNNAPALFPAEPKKDVNSKPANPTTKVDYRPNGAEGPRWMGNSTVEAPPIISPPHQAAKPAIGSDQPARQIVNTTKVFLDYQIENAGLSGVGRVEAWITRDKGQSWHKVGAETKRKSPIEVQLPGEGLFGVTLIASNGRGVTAGPPAMGDAPDGWIEVDTTKPSAQITAVRNAVENGKAVVHIGWSSADKNFGDAPVELFFAATPQGPWLPIVKGLKSEGTHRWAPPVEIGAQAHLRLIAKDAAGNIGIASTLEPVLFDDPARPRAVIRNISTSAPAPQSPTTPIPVRVVPAPVTPSDPLPIVQPPPVD